MQHSFTIQKGTTRRWSTKPTRACVFPGILVHKTSPSKEPGPVLNAWTRPLCQATLLSANQFRKCHCQWTPLPLSYASYCLSAGGCVIVCPVLRDVGMQILLGNFCVRKFTCVWRAAVNTKNETFCIDRFQARWGRTDWVPSVSLLLWLSLLKLGVKGSRLATMEYPLCACCVGQRVLLLYSKERTTWENDWVPFPTCIDKATCIGQSKAASLNVKGPYVSVQRRLVSYYRWRSRCGQSKAASLGVKGRYAHVQQRLGSCCRWRSPCWDPRGSARRPSSSSSCAISSRMSTCRRAGSRCTTRPSSSTTTSTRYVLV